MIKPTISRVVWLRNRPGQLDQNQPEDAHIVYVHSDNMINVAGWDANGDPFKATSVVLIQDGDPPPTYVYAEWMPFQKGQAAAQEKPAHHGV